MTLDQKLSLIIEDIQEYTSDEPLRTGDFTFIEQIKQAFIDNGWITPEQVQKTQELVNQMANIAQDMAKLPVTIETYSGNTMNVAGNSEILGEA